MDTFLSESAPPGAASVAAWMGGTSRLTLGTKPMREAMPHADRIDDHGVDLVAQCLAYTPNQRIVAKDALNHPYFNGLNKETVGTVPLPL